MKRIPMLVARDGMDAAAHLAMGLAAVFALVGFFGSLVRVSDEAPRIAQSLERWQDPNVDTLVARTRTNAPCPCDGEGAPHPGAPAHSRTVTAPAPTIRTVGSDG